MKKFYSFLVVCTLLFCYTGNVWAYDPLTVASCTATNNMAPVYGSRADSYCRTQVIYPASMLSSISGKQITALTFYVNTTATEKWTSTFEIRMAEVSASSFSSKAWNTEKDGTLVYTGALDGTSSTMVVTLNTPFVYNGGNLLLDVRNQAGGNWKNAKFYGITSYQGEAIYGVVSGYSSSATFNPNENRQKFVPKTSFTYEDAASASCADPSALTISSISTTSASFSWTAGSSETSWQYICLPAATTVDWESAAVKTATSAEATISNLIAGTDYKFYVRANCGSDQSGHIYKAFTTLCDPYTTSSLPYTTDFESSDCAAGSMPTCWRRITTNVSYPSAVYENNPATGSQCLRFYGKEVQYAILPPFEADVKNLMVSFYYRNAYSNSSSPQLIVGYMTDPNDASTFVPVETMSRITTYNSDKSEVDMSDADGAGAHYIAFKYTESSFSTMDWINVDDIEVDILGTCFKPASIADASSITSDGATLSWTASGKGETTYQWAVAEGSADPVWVDDAAHKVSGTSKALTGLESNTNYTFHVRSYCAADDQSLAISKAFKTRCGTISESLWEYDFEDDATYDVPTCWKTYAGTYYFAYVLGSNVHSGSRAMSIAAGKTDENRTYVILPKFDLALSNLSITFYYRGTANATIEVGYVTDVDDKTTFVKVGDALTAATTYKQGFTSFASVAATGQIAFRFKGATGDGDFNIDDIRVARTVTLADNVDNSSLISSLAAEGETIDILLKRKIWMDGYYNTICLPFSLSADQLADADCPLNNFNLKVFDYTRTENDEVHMFITGASSIEAGVPYFASYQGTPTSDKTEHLFRDVKVTATSAGEKTSEIVTYKGFYTQTVLANQSENASPVIFYLSRNNTIYWPDQDVTLNGFRAYFAVDYSAGAPARPIRRICFADQQEDTATGITGTNSGVTTVKRVENNQVIIIRDGVKYTLLGQKIQ